MIKIYGTPRTSAGRCYLMLEEVGQPYEAISLDMMEKREHKAPAYLKLNPNGKVPCLVDGDFVIWESVAINSYLAEKFKPELLGSNAAEKGLVNQWSTWCMVELQPPMIDIIIQEKFTPADKRDTKVIARAKDKIPPLLQILDDALKDKTYLVGDRYTLADINAASVVNIAGAIQLPIDAYKNIGAWMTRIRERPSFKKFIELRK